MKTTRPLSLLIAILLIFGNYAYAEETQLTATAQSTDEISEQNKANFDSLINNIESNLINSETASDNQVLTVNPAPTAPSTELITTSTTSANTNNVSITETKTSNTENTSSPSTTPNNSVVIAASSNSANSSANVSSTVGANTAVANTKISAAATPAEKKSGFSLVEVLQLAASVASLLITIY